jgi:hypothetical protein
MNPIILPEYILSLGKAGLTADEGCQLLDLRGITYSRRPQLPPGWPDITFSYLGIPCGWTILTERGKLSQDQIACLATMQAHPNRWCCAIIRSAAEAKGFLDALDGETFTITSQ